MDRKNVLGEIDAGVQNGDELPLPIESMGFATPSRHFDAVRRDASGMTRLARDGVSLSFVRPHNTHLSTMRIELDDLTRPAVHELLREHLANMYELSPADKVFALDLTKLRSPDITFWTVWDGDTLLGCGALKELSPVHGEVKSMRTPETQRRRGAGRAVLGRIIETARQRGYEWLSLETGTHPAFLVAQDLYRRFGFDYCGPFSTYKEDPHSVFMSLRLAKGAP